MVESPCVFLLHAGGPSRGRPCRRVFLYLSISYLGVARAMPFCSLTSFVLHLARHHVHRRKSGRAHPGGHHLHRAGQHHPELQEARGHLLAAKIPLARIRERRHRSPLVSPFRKLAFAYVAAPIMGATLSTLTGFIFLVTFIPFFPKDQKPNQFHVPRAWLIYGWCGLLNALGFFLHFTAISMGDLSVVAPLTSTAPIFSLTMSFFLLRRMERITPTIIIGTACMVLGAALIGWRIR